MSAGRGRWATLATSLTSVALLASCTSSASVADQRLCAEVARVAGELVELGEPGDSPDMAHEVRILASHLLVASSGDPEGEPSRELAATVRAVGMAATSSTPEVLDGLAASYDACEGAGVTLDRSPLETLFAR
jgi:hypothetical protein